MLKTITIVKHDKQRQIQNKIIYLHNTDDIWVTKYLEVEVVLKSMASDMPTHVMSCFRLPKTVTRKLKSAIAHFGVVVGIIKVSTSFLGIHVYV